MKQENKCSKGEIEVFEVLNQITIDSSHERYCDRVREAEKARLLKEVSSNQPSYRSKTGLWVANLLISVGFMLRLRYQTR